MAGKHALKLDKELELELELRTPWSNKSYNRFLITLSDLRQATNKWAQSFTFKKNISRRRFFATKLLGFDKNKIKTSLDHAAGGL